MGVYKPNAAGFTKLATGAKVRAHMLKIGEYWASDLRAYRPPSGTGTYADSITVELITVEINGLPRAAVRITANAEYSAILEVGSKDIPNPPRPMTKLLDAIQAADPSFHANNAKRAARTRKRG